MRMAAQSASTALRLGLSATLPLIFVAYAAWTGALGGAAAPSELYAVWNSAQNGGEGGYQPYGEQSYAQQPAQLQAMNPYYNAVNTAELSTNVNPYDAAALQYSGSGPPQNQMQTLHALASAKRLYHQMQAPGGSAKSEYNSAVTSADNPAAALQSLQSKVGSGSSASKQIAQASLAIEQVMQQSKADHKLAKAATRSARVTKDGGNSWKSLLSRQSGPRATVLASDWLATAVATSKSKGEKTKYARAQLEAALSQVDGKYNHNAEAGAWQNQRRERNSELAAMSKLAHAVMFKALSGESTSGPSAVAPISESWSTNSAGAGYSGSSGGFGGGAGGFGGGSGGGGGGGGEWAAAGRQAARRP